MQHKAGIRLLCVDEHALAQEEDLIADFGLSGHSSVGILEPDSASRTLQFRLSFDNADVAEYQKKWERLLLYATEWHPSSSTACSGK